jgi:hypothetical protein
MPYSMPCSAGGVPRDYYPVHSVGLSRVRSGHRRCRLIWVTVILAVLAAPATAAVASPPAIDQYTQHLPEAGGGSIPSSGGTPAAQPGLLSEKTQAALSGPDGRRLAQIATARDLGAPAAAGRRASAAAHAGTAVTGNEQGFATVAADTALSGPGLVLVGALGGIALVGGWSRSIRRGRASGDLN